MVLPYVLFGKVFKIIAAGPFCLDGFLEIWQVYFINKKNLNVRIVILNLLEVCSMIKVINNGNIFDSKMQTITCTINTVGVMGRGIALEFKRRYPNYYKGYRKHCEQGLVTTGKIYLHKKTNPWILSFPTKEHWKNPSKIEWIEQGLDYLADNYKRMGIESLALPALGCANGGLDWEIIRILIIKKLENLPIEIELYAPI